MVSMAMLVAFFAGIGIISCEFGVGHAPIHTCTIPHLLIRTLGGRRSVAECGCAREPHIMTTFVMFPLLFDPFQ